MEKQPRARFSYASFVIGILSGALTVIGSGAILARPAIERIAEDRAKLEAQRVERYFEIRYSDLKAELVEIKQELKELRRELKR